MLSALGQHEGPECVGSTLHKATRGEIVQIVQKPDMVS